ncbi:hypothetical protein TNIN_209061 [Trichonephila inaurata madagascariensis]|uniref:Uncharacterized protein n=1 Tax=Trichonephila inaurata madagascariensis TaxID=2747483 RepID=A0A8X6WRE4_9ARAC|nr:hypothetical protein TNIN_209061 [Trichonephila inaurata madagascariensis]
MHFNVDRSSHTASIPNCHYPEVIETLQFMMHSRRYRLTRASHRLRLRQIFVYLTSVAYFGTSSSFDPHHVIRVTTNTPTSKTNDRLI